VCKLAEQVARGRVRLAAAGGTADPEHPFGADAMQVLAAIESVYGDDGVLVLMDLGSAVLSAETALEFLPEEKRARVRLCGAPLVEGAVAAAALAAAGATLDETIREAQDALAGKASQLGTAPPALVAAVKSKAERLVEVVNAHGLHARPAAQLVRLARRFEARVSIENVTRASGPADAAGINAVLGLAARQGHVLRLCAGGVDARAAVDALAAFIASGCGERDTPEVPGGPGQQAEGLPHRQAEGLPYRQAEGLPHPEAHGQLTGIPASAGIAIGPLARLHPTEVQCGDEPADEPEAEWARLTTALGEAKRETQSLYQWALDKAGANEAGIFDAQALFLEDPEVLAFASRAVFSERRGAAQAWRTAAAAMAARLASLDDPYLQARAADVADAAARVLRRLVRSAHVAPRFAEPSIVAAHDLTPSEVRGLEQGQVLGICLEAGAASAHGVILARAAGIPAVVGLGPALAAVPEGTAIALDGERGALWLSPDTGQTRLLHERRERWLAVRREAEAERRRPAATRDGRRIRVLANIGAVAGAVEAVEHGAEGVGVLRTEFLFLERAQAPGEEEQLAAYRAIVEVLGGRPLVIRTLDVGGDKDLPYLEMEKEANPFLGWRGIRLTLGEPELMRTQIRAILRAAACGPVQLLLPMIAAMEELRGARALVSEAEAALEREGTAFGRGLKVGVMIEAPSAAATAGALAREADFFSIGSNDLTQYTMAADRTNPRVASLADPFQPAVIRLIRQTVEAARAAGIEATLCGEMAADPLAAPLLIGLGLEEFSVSARLIPELKRAIARWTAADAERLAREALQLDTAATVRELLRQARDVV
jgi:phosphocarrier protein FPr